MAFRDCVGAAGSGDARFCNKVLDTKAMFEVERSELQSLTGKGFYRFYNSQSKTYLCKGFSATGLVAVQDSQHYDQKPCWFEITDSGSEG